MPQLNKIKAPVRWATSMCFLFEDNANAEFRVLLRTYDRQTELLNPPTISMVKETLSSDPIMAEALSEMLVRHKDRTQSPYPEKTPADLGYRIVVSTSKQSRELLEKMHDAAAITWSNITNDAMGNEALVSTAFGRTVIEHNLKQYVDDYYELLRSGTKEFREAGLFKEMTRIASKVGTQGVLLVSDLQRKVREFADDCLNGNESRN